MASSGGSPTFANYLVLSPSQITANQDNYAPTGGVVDQLWRLSTDASRNVTGISLAQASGNYLVLVNVGSNNIVLKHDVTSTAANRFYCPGATDLTLGQYQSVILEYDGTLSRWVALGISASMFPAELALFAQVFS